jgi:hypothetical protein
VNTASQDLPHHLGILRERLFHPTDYEGALYYFLEEFAGDQDFIVQSVSDPAPGLVAVVGHVAQRTLTERAPLQAPRVFHLPEHQFYHGNAAIAGRVVLFFYFEATDTGLLALIPGVRGEVEVARFKQTQGLKADPQKN